MVGANLLNGEARQKISWIMVRSGNAPNFNKE